MHSIQVSTIIPCYNVTDYIDECIGSILAQTHKVAEVICVDNNSTDDTFLRLRAWEARDNRIKVFRESKKGASAARNTGLRCAQAEWIQFLDADDLLLPEKISHQLSLLKNADCDFIAGAYLKRTFEGNERVKTVIESPWRALFVTSLGCTCSNLWNRASLLAVNGWNEEMQSSQESDLMWRMMSQGFDEIIIDQQPLTIVRTRSGGQISTTNIQENLKRYAVLRMEISTYLEKNKPEIWLSNINFFIRNLNIMVTRLLQMGETTLARQLIDKWIMKGLKYLPLQERFLAGLGYRLLGIRNYARVRKLLS